MKGGYSAIKEVSLINDNLARWKVCLNMHEQLDDPLVQDMDKYGITCVELEIRFSSEYPHKPPFIRIVSPRFAHITGHVNMGAICEQILTNSGWTPLTSIPMLMIHIQGMIFEGKGRLGYDCKIPYSYEEAVSAFKRITSHYGWI